MNRISTFFRRAARTNITLGLIATFISFGLFLIKDNVRDSTRDLAGSIARAEDTSLIQTSSIREFNELVRIERVLDEYPEQIAKKVEEKLHPSGGGSSTWGFSRIGLEETADEENTAELSLANSADLLEKIRRQNDPEEVTVQSIRVDIVAFRQQYGAVRALSKQHQLDYGRGLDAAFYALQDSGDKIAKSVANLAKVVSDKAEAERLHYEKSLRLWNIVTYTLGGISLVLSVLGIVFGGKQERVGIVE